jgi:exo-1,4-beta-D-glucosaminidase
MKKIVVCVFSVLALPLALRAGTVTHLHDGWRLQSACKLDPNAGGGTVIATAGFPDESWLKASVPATVLAAQAAAGTVPDPYYGSNLRQIAGTTYPLGYNFSKLPMADDSPYRCGWWYRTEFTLPGRPAANKRFWLKFGGINYRAEIWLNGRQVAGSKGVAGAYRTYQFDVTELVKPGQNVLAVETFAPTEKDLGINWVDWNPCPPDKDMGLWGAVDLEETGAVTVNAPTAVTHFTDGSLSEADLTVYATLHNALDHPVKGVVAGAAAGARFEKQIELGSHEEREVSFTSGEFPALRIHDPKLWWPHQMGEPHLERLTVSFTPQSGPPETEEANFGIREITSEFTANGSRLFRVNGKPILIRGGGWSQDMLLRTDSKRLRDQFRMVRDMNLNTLRLEGKLETEEFFHLADEQGILVMAGWCCCDHWERWKDWTPEDLTIATASLQSQMMRLRSHPSLLVWLNGSDNPPPANVERAYLKVESDSHWPNPTISSASQAPTTVTGPSGVKMTGPYDYVAPSYWYVDQHNGGAYGFNTETSPGPAIPSLASRETFLPDASAWPPTANWSFHNGGGEFVNLKVFDQAMEAVYGAASSAAQYERLAQTMTYDSERAMFEAYSKNKYQSTGVIQWMLNNAWPSMIWHLYDYNLEADAGYFAAKKACEPLHIQYSYDDQSIVVVNSTYQPASELHASVSVHNLTWKELYRSERAVDSAADSAQRIFTVPAALYAGPDRLLLIDLTLTNKSGSVVSRNVYWVPTTLTTFDWAATDFTHTPALRHEDMNALTNLPKSRLRASAELRQSAAGREVLVHLENPSEVLSFQVAVAARTSSGGLIAPVLWSDNWIEVMPGESVTLTGILPEGASLTQILQISGWNIDPQTITPVTADPRS